MLIFVSEFIHRKKEAGAAEVFGTTEAYGNSSKANGGKMLPTCVLKPVHGKCFSVVVILCLDKLSCCATGMLCLLSKDQPLEFFLT